MGGTSKSSSSADTENILSTVLANEVNALIGDAALSEDEKHAKELEALQQSSGDDGESAAIEKLSALSENGGLDEASEQKVVWAVDANGKKVGKKSVFVI